jgi:pimeloyl-ACP methyl ester carboxylesterase
VATYAIVPGAGDRGWHWHLVEAELRQRGHDVVAVDLPCEDASAGLGEYADTVVAAVGDPSELVVVAHSLGGFTAPLVCARLPAELLVLTAGMVPRPGERGADWWTNTGVTQAQEDYGDDLIAQYLHDVPPELAAEALARGRDQTMTPMLEPWPLDAWPDVRTRYVLFRDDRFFPADWTRAMVRERLGIEADEIGGGHCAYLSRPAELAAKLEELRLAG